VVHRAIKILIKDRLVSEKKAKTGRAFRLHLTEKGEKYRRGLIQARREADEKLRRALTPIERTTLLRLLTLIANLEF